MTSGATTNPIAADTPPRVSRHGFVLFAAIAVLWTVLSWFVVDRVVTDRTAALEARETAQAREDVSSISQNFERVLNRLQGLPAVLAAGSDVVTVLGSFGPAVSASQLSRDAKLSDWTKRPDVGALNTQLLGVAREMDVDIVWVMNPSGDCIASSNFQDTTSFIG